MTKTVPWSRGTWTNEPARVTSDADGLYVTAREGSDAWRTTSYGFVHASEHALLAPLAPESALEVQFRLTFSGQFDQAGIFVDPGASVTAGPFCCAPSRAGLTVHFTSWRSTPADAGLHPAT